MSFERAVSFVLSQEGGASHHPDDPGGETFFGISRRAYPDIPWPPTSEQAIALYHRDYWTPIRGEELPPGLDLVMLDTAVNHGGARAIRLLQTTLGVTVDGILGPQTLGAAQVANIPWVVEEFLARRAMVYATLPTFTIFGLGWMRRTMRCLAVALA